MAKIVSLPTHIDPSGKINVIEKILPFKVKRIYFIYNISSDRGGHAHKKNKQAVLAINGHCKILIRRKKFKKVFNLKNKNELLILNPEDWHLIKNCSKDLILLVLASQNYDPKDYLKDY